MATSAGRQKVANNSSPGHEHTLHRHSKRIPVRTASSWTKAMGTGGGVGVGVGMLMTAATTQPL